MRAIAIADSGAALSTLTGLLAEFPSPELRHASGRTHVTALVRDFEPDLVLIETHWPPDALARLDEARRAAPAAAIIVLAERLEDDWLADALRGGATAVLPADSARTTFRQVVGEVMSSVPVAA
jgi:DNA-binding NarL/FixJ family response regulator